MIGVLRSYSEYQDSGVSWLGPIPDHWERVHGGAVLQQKKVRNRGMVEDTVLSLSYGRIVIKPPEKLHGLVPESFETYQIVDPGDIIVRPTDLQNDWTTIRVAIARDRGIITSAYLCFHARKPLTPEYTHLLLLGYDMKKVFYGMGSGLRQNLDWSDFKRLLMLVPPAEEQHAIVRYVAWLDRRVRRFIRNRRRLIEVLNEQKQAIINRAVTRGLNSDAPLKPSGIGWLGDIPAHWEVRRLRNVVSMVTSGSRGWSSYAADDGPLFIRIANLRRISLDFRFDSVVRLNLPRTSELRRTQVRPNDLLISITAYIGSIAVVPPDFEEAYVSQHVARCTPRDMEHNSRWMGYVLLSEVGQTHGRLSLYGGTKDGLSLNDVKNYPMLLPPRDEQNRIVEHLERSLTAVDRAIRRTRREINLIREYRTRLISDVVTGKIDVRHLAPQAGSEDLEDMAETLEPLEHVIDDVEMDEEENVHESD